MLNKKLLAVLSVLITLTSLIGLASNADARNDPYALNLKNSLGYNNQIKPGGPPQLTLRPSFENLKAACMRSAGTIASYYQISFDGTTREACGCIASHAQVTGVPDAVADTITGHLNSGNIKRTAASKFRNYSSVLEYCLADEFDD